MAGYKWRMFVPVAVACLFSLAGCQFSDLVPDRTTWDSPAPKDPVLVLFTIDVSDGGRWPDGMKIERLNPDSSEVIKKSWKYKFKGRDEYVVMCEELSTGTYRVNELYVDAGPGIVVFDLKDDQRFRRTFSRPGVYYLGAYKYHTILPPNRIGRMKFDLEQTQGPGEREAIERLLVAKEAKNEYWKDQLTRRLQQLGKR